MIIPALTGASFARWCFFDYLAAIHLLNDPLAVSPNNGCGNPFRGIRVVCSRIHPVPEGQQISIPAIALAPESPGVRFIVADAYTYGNVPDPQRAFAEASFELAGG